MFNQIVGGLVPALPEVGKIKIGGLYEGQEYQKAQGEGTFRRPVKYDHFEIRKLTRLGGNKVNLDRDDAVMAKLAERAKADPSIRCKCGQGVTEIPILLPFHDMTLNLPHAFRAYEGRHLFCSGDGEKARRRHAEKDGPGWDDLDYCQCPYLTDPDFQRSSGIACKPHGALYVIMPDAGTVGGCYVLRTTSWVTLRGLLGSMSYIATVTGGILAGIPLKLKVIEQEHEFTGKDKKIQRTTQPHVTLVYDLRDKTEDAHMAMLRDAGRMLGAVQAGAANHLAMAKAQRLYLASAPVEAELDASTPEEIAAEFHPPEASGVADPGEPAWRPDAELAALATAIGWAPGKVTLRLGELEGNVAALRSEMEGIKAMGPDRPSGDRKGPSGTPAAAGTADGSPATAGPAQGNVAPPDGSSPWERGEGQGRGQEGPGAEATGETAGPGEAAGKGKQAPLVDDGAVERQMAGRGMRRGGRKAAADPGSADRAAGVDKGDKATPEPARKEGSDGGKTNKWRW